MRSICDLFPHEAARIPCGMFVCTLRSYSQPYCSTVSITSHNCI